MMRDFNKNNRLSFSLVFSENFYGGQGLDEGEQSRNAGSLVSPIRENPKIKSKQLM